MFRLQRLKKTNILILGIAFMLCVIGSMNIFSTTYYPDLKTSQLFYNQILFYIVGFIIFAILASFDFKLLNKAIFQWLIYFATIALLVLVLFIGEEVLGARRWINFGFITIQPSEIAKLTVVLNISFIFTRRKINNSKKIAKVEKKYSIKELKRNIKSKNLIVLTYLTLELSTILSLVLLQRSLGNTLLIIGIFLSLVFLKIVWYKKYWVLFVSISLGLLIGLLQRDGQFELKIYFLALLIILILIYFLAKKFRVSKLLSVVLLLVTSQIFLFTNIFYNNLKPYQQARIDSFIGKNSEVETAINWNKEQSLIALGSGRLVGKGYLKGTQSNYKYLPFSYTDFAFASYSEQFGYLGILFLTTLYALLFNSILQIAIRSRSDLGKYISTGCAFILALNTFQHMGMNIGKLPITGVPLPFISYGGSSTIVAFVALGLIMSVNNSVGKDSSAVKVEVKRSKYYDKS